MIDYSALLSPYTLEVFGALTGVLGLSIAVYLQLVSGRQVRPRYVLGFYFVGTVLLLLHMRPLNAGPAASAVLRGVGLTAILVAELAAFYHVYRVSDVQTPNEVVEDVVAHLDRR